MTTLLFHFFSRAIWPFTKIFIEHRAKGKIGSFRFFFLFFFSFTFHYSDDSIVRLINDKQQLMVFTQTQRANSVACTSALVKTLLVNFEVFVFSVNVRWCRCRNAVIAPIPTDAFGDISSKVVNCRLSKA